MAAISYSESVAITPKLGQLILLRVWLVQQTYVDTWSTYRHQFLISHVRHDFNTGLCPSCVLYIPAVPCNAVSDQT